MLINKMLLNLTASVILKFICYKLIEAKPLKS